MQGNLARAVADAVGEGEIAELRLRAGKAPLAVTISGKRIKICPFAGFSVLKDDIDGILLRATNMSLYSVSDELLQGYIPANGVRIGVGGEGVAENGKLIGMKNICYLVIRVPHQVKGAADEVFEHIALIKDGAATVKSTLVIAPPCGGKTTMLRELARKASQFKSTVIIDERREIACAVNGAPTLDVGDSEVISGVKKCVAYENALRAMSPEVLVTDELFRKEEVQMIEDAVRTGVKVFASVHGENLESLKRSEIFAPLVGLFEVAVELSPPPVGKISAIRTL